MKIWLMASRPRTLPAAVAPVLVGTAAAVVDVNHLRVAAFIAALVGSIFIQVGTNLANDYSDARRGADAVDRLGPVRVTAAGLVTPRRVLVATWLAFAIAIACGVYLATVAGPIIIAVGVASILAGVLYTGGPRPYGYAGLGEVFVFLFFFRARRGQRLLLRPGRGARRPPSRALDRDRRPGDGDPRRQQRPRHRDRPGVRERTRLLCGPGAIGLGASTGLLVLAYLALPVTLLVADGPWWAMLGWLSLPLSRRAAEPVLTRTDGPSLNGALAKTGALLGVFALLVTAGLLIAS